MPYGSVLLQPGVDVEKTPTLNVAGVSQSSLIRYREGLIQKYGGWTSFIGTTVTGLPRDLHAWEDLNNNKHLAIATIGTASQLAMITGTTIASLTPQIYTSNFTPAFGTQQALELINIFDPNIGDLTTGGTPSVVFNTPVSVGEVILSGSYLVTEANASVTQFFASYAAASTIASGGLVPQFTATTNASGVNVRLPNHNLATADIVVFNLSTNVGGLSIVGAYSVVTIPNINNFTIQTPLSATSSTTVFMNKGLAQIVYNLSFPAGPSVPLVTNSDWTSDNWGEILLACPAGGTIWQYDPVLYSWLPNAYPVGTAPAANNGIFVSTSQQILIAYGSSVNQSLGFEQEPLLVQWSDSGNYAQWTPSSTNQAGNYVIPTGSKIIGGMATPNQNLIWTDEDCWSMNYLGFPLVYGFNKIGSGAGLISSHAAQQLSGNVYWMGPQNFYSMTSNGLAVIPCSVWDFVFQNLNANFVQNVRAMPNTPFNEVGWLFPSNASVNGECDCYVKYNTVEPNAPWDFGPSNALQRSAWIDQNVLGNPIGADSSGNIWQHEMGNNNGALAMVSSFTTAYFMLGDGEDFAFIDQILPDFIWGDYGGAQTATINLTFNVVNYPGDTPTSYGPYAVTRATEFITVRFRGRQMSITVESGDLNSFWRLGRIRYRFARSGRR